MNFNSFEFLIFLPTVIVLYWLVPHRFRWFVLLLASYFFYMSWNAWLIFAILGTTCVSYGAAILIGKTQNIKIKKLLLALAIIICLGTLVFFKYFNFLIQSAIDFLNLFALNIKSPALDIILPVGISFYTFQTLSYVIDVYRGKFAPEKHLGYYALFVAYFPQLVAGPIEKPGDLLPQLRAEHNLNWDDMSEGFRWLLSGFFRKCVVADFCGIFVNNIFANVSEANSLAIFLGGLLFFIQMYCDFAGYSEIAMGCARMMGVKLTKNFDRPELSLSTSEFFRRWHITLGRWFTEYLYFPLGGSRKGKVRTVINTIIVFTLSGLWHGANWTFVVWGIFCGVILCLENILRKPFGKFLEKKNIDKNSFAIIALRRVWAISIAVTTSLIFRAQSLPEVGALFAGMFTRVGVGVDYVNSTLATAGLSIGSVLQIVLCVICMFHLHRLTDEKKSENVGLTVLKNKSASKVYYLQEIGIIVLIILAVALSWLALIASGDNSSFQYFQF